MPVLQRQATALPAAHKFQRSSDSLHLGIHDLAMSECATVIKRFCLYSLQSKFRALNRVHACCAMLQVHGQKRSAEIDYPLHLDMSKYAAQHDFMEGWTWNYTLGAGILHNGISGSGGHYTMFQRCPDNKWVMRDDTARFSVADPLAFKKEIVGLVYHRYALLLQSCNSCFACVCACIPAFVMQKTFGL